MKETNGTKGTRMKGKTLNDEDCCIQYYNYRNIMNINFKCKTQPAVRV